MDALHHFPAKRSVMETEDIAADFIENELGRHDWSNNWAAYKSKHPNVKDKVAEWLVRVGYQADPAEIEKHIDRMTLARPGKWR